MDRFDLGAHSRTVSTPSPEAQRWFDLGLNWCFGFNKEEGVKCFRKALDYDPECVMAHWGHAYGTGPFYNLTWREHGEKEADTAARRASEHVEKARALSHRATDLENQLIEALARRHQKPHVVPPEEFDRWDDDYAAEMRRVYYSYPDDHDVMALYIEALITRTPRRLWNVKTGIPAKGSDVVEALQACERSIQHGERSGQAAASGDPASPHPRARDVEHAGARDARGRRARHHVVRTSGHLNHMPGHIYVLCGDYEKARLASCRAIRANDMFLDYAGPFTFYTVACCHDLHLMMHTCMFLGPLQGRASHAADKICGLLTKDVLSVKGRPKFAMSLEGYYATRMHVLVRFGRWQDIIDAAAAGRSRACTWSPTAMHHYAKGMAHATLQELPRGGRGAGGASIESVGRIPQQRRFFNNPAHDVFGGGRKNARRRARVSHWATTKRPTSICGRAFAATTTSSTSNPGHGCIRRGTRWRALLSEQGHYSEAEQVYRDDLGLSGKIQRCAQHPDNVWALHGLVECLQMRGDTKELPALQREAGARRRGWQTCRSHRPACVGGWPPRPTVAAPDRDRRAGTDCGVIPAFIAGIHLAATPTLVDSWIPGTSPGMTTGL